MRRDPASNRGALVLKHIDVRPSLNRTGLLGTRPRTENQAREAAAEAVICHRRPKASATIKIAFPLTPVDDVMTRCAANNFAKPSHPRTNGPGAA